MLTFTKLVLRNLRYHARGNIAVLLGVAVGAAVLTGALLVGDSLRGSLRARAERQLGGVESVAFLPRPVRAALADELPGAVAPVLMLPGSLQATGNPATAPYLGRITLLGVDARFAPQGNFDIDWKGTGKQVVLSHRVAGKLKVQVGDRIHVGVERLSDVPRSSSLAKRATEDVTAKETLEVVAILDADARENDFNLTPNPAAPLNVFLPIRTLSRIALGSLEPRATVLLSLGSQAADADLNFSLSRLLTTDDFGLKFREIDYLKRANSGGYLSVEATELILPAASVSAIESAAAALGVRAEPTVIYVADTLAHGEKEIAYPIIAGVNPTAAAPLGPFLPPTLTELGNDEVILLNWEGSQLNGLNPSSKLRMTFFDPDVEGEGQLREAEITLRAYIAFPGAAQDRHLTPEIPGVTDARANLFDWDRPPVLPKAEIRRRVPDTDPRANFFNQYKATPMAYVNLATARKLFNGRYGSDTSIRIAPLPGESLEQLEQRLRGEIPNHLDAKAAGFEFDPIRARLLSASKGGTDFGGLFLGFSLFLIVAALMLVALLFRLTLDRRAKEIGLLLAAGYSLKEVRRLLLVEGMLLAMIGAVLGLVAGVAYNQLLLHFLLELWPDSEVRHYLQPHAAPASFVIAFVLAVAMAFITLRITLRGLAKVTPPALLRGETTVTTASAKPSSRWTPLLCAASLILGTVCLFVGGSQDNPDIQAMMFFGGGALLLTAALGASSIWLRRTRHSTVSGNGIPALARLGIRNAARNPLRSLLTATLIAAAAFLLVAVESFRRQPGAEFLEKAGGSGGYNVIAETDVPLFQPFDTGLGRADLEKQLHDAFSHHAAAEHQEKNSAAYHQALAQLEAIREVLPLRLRDGDDASCANLFQATRPRVLGVPQSLIEGEKRFKFYDSLAKTDAEKANPWRLLANQEPDGAIPVFCEQNTAQWMLKKGIGDTLTMPGDDGTELTFRIVGTLVDSPFQSEIICSDTEFTRCFPKRTGYRSFLIRTEPGSEEAVARILQIAFRTAGFTATSARERVESYQAVIGAYLSTFQLLGGFGLALGALGLAVVVVRGVWERIGELALLRAVGYRTRALQFLVVVENALLLFVGLGCGVAAALASVAPHIAAGADIPWMRLGGLLGVVVFIGLGVAILATTGILRVPLIPALRRE